MQVRDMKTSEAWLILFDLKIFKCFREFFASRFGVVLDEEVEVALS